MASLPQLLLFSCQYVSTWDKRGPSTVRIGTNVLLFLQSSDTEKYISILKSKLIEEIEKYMFKMAAGEIVNPYFMLTDLQKLYLRSN